RHRGEPAPLPTRFFPLGVRVRIRRATQRRAAVRSRGMLARRRAQTPGRPCRPALTAREVARRTRPTPVRRANRAAATHWRRTSLELAVASVVRGPSLVNPLERQAVREVLAEVRQEMDAMLGQSQTSTSMDEGRLAEVVHDVAARWLRARANANLPLVPDPARVEEAVMNWLVRMGPLEPLICNPAY